MWLTFFQNDKPNSAHKQPQPVPGTQGFTSQGPGSVAGDGLGDAAFATENFGIAPPTAGRYCTFARAWPINAIEGNNEGRREGRHPGRQTPTVHLALTGTWPRRCGRRRIRGFCRSTPKSTSCCSIGPAGRSVRTSAGQSRLAPILDGSGSIDRIGCRRCANSAGCSSKRPVARVRSRGRRALLATVVSGKDGGPSRFCLRMRIDAARRPL